MPFGKKTISYEKNKKSHSKEINFDKEYKKIITKLKRNNLCFYRIDTMVQTDIMNKMYRAIASADIVVANLTGLNPNVMYELGVRHSLKKKKTIMYWMKELQESVPFDINTHSILDKNQLINEWDNILKDDTDDSPVKKEVSNENINDKSVFDNFKNSWQKFETEYSKMENSTNYKSKLDFLKKYSESFKGIEDYETKLALATYKCNEKEISNESNKTKGFYEAWDIIERLKPKQSINGEVVGLACSISRKIFEMNNDDSGFKNTSIELAMHFISIFNYPYSHSSLILCLTALVEAKELSKESCIDFLKIFYNKYKNMETSEKDEYYEYTLNLYDLIINKKKMELGAKTSDSHRSDTSLNTYKRVLNVFN